MRLLLQQSELGKSRSIEEQIGRETGNTYQGLDAQWVSMECSPHWGQLLCPIR